MESDQKKEIDWLEIFEAQEWDIEIHKKIMAGWEISFLYSSDNEQKK